ncbi:hypothetical protein CCM_03358 [Cordyceps militaris CM01]|uniref:Uncharacterized protein n=1 Tax=Cordyceps militaris (strain CM01) TaxID=983644 RepID=G3JAB8_CORMM|nr:uncharacterized protein CCM_03358 [Cordyceps militaris CM01]EGX95086.1 hypothetical protein CCM_03358 [Cordyceps militaris CM01]
MPSTSPRYSTTDVETASIRSAAPSYGEQIKVQMSEAGTGEKPKVVQMTIFCNWLIQPIVSEAPSYHSTVPNPDAAPLYTPRIPLNPAQSTQSTSTVQGDSHDDRRRREPAQLETIGLPPVPAHPPTRVPSHLLMWAAADTPTTRHYRKVAERRVVDGRYQAAGSPERQRTARLLEEHNAANGEAFRPLEDPYLVGEQAAAEARRERLAREGSGTTLQQEERQWDWLIGQYKLP